MATRNLQKFVLTLKRQKEFVSKLESLAETLVIFAAEMQKSENPEFESTKSEMDCHLRDLAIDVLTFKKRFDRVEALANELAKMPNKTKEKSLSWDEVRAKSLSRSFDGRIVINDSTSGKSVEF